MKVFWHTLLNWFRRPLKRTTSEIAPAFEPSTVGLALPERGEVIPFDDTLVERALVQWHMGDWESLIQIDRNSIQHHPERAKLALLICGGHQQDGNSAEASHYLHLAKDWGCGKVLAAHVLIASAHNTLGRAAVLLGEVERADDHFRLAVTAMPAAHALHRRARYWKQRGSGSSIPPTSELY